MPILNRWIHSALLSLCVIIGSSLIIVARATEKEPINNQVAHLLKKGETDLVLGHAELALPAFEQAANLEHAADIEMGILRSFMQLGEYRRALAFAAHTAGAHQDEPGGSALYAWLLHCGGQRTFAQQFLKEAQVRMPNEVLLGLTKKQLDTAAPIADGLLLEVPNRLAPYSYPDQPIPAQAAVVGSALLVNAGKSALVPTVVIAHSREIFLRNGLGNTTRATVQSQSQELGLSLLRLDSALPAQNGLVVPSRDAFPGSIAYAIDYVSSIKSDPAWPLLYQGFLGMPDEATSLRLLGIDIPDGQHGGPVLDGAGRLVGLILPTTDKAQTGAKTRFVPISRLRQQFGELFGAISEQPASAKIPTDEVYEKSLGQTLQVMTAP